MDGMTSRERVLAVINGDLPDRVPLDYWGTQEVTDMLLRHFGVGSSQELWKALHIDKITSVGPKYVGPKLRSYPDGSWEDMWGCRHRWQEYPTGRYDEVTYNPLSDAETPDDLEKYRWPSADWFDFSGVSADCEELKGHATTAGSIYFSYYYAWLTGMEKHLSDLALTPELARAIIGRLTNFQVEYLSRLFEAGAGKIDMTYIGDDFGMQDRLLVGLPMWREFFAPSYRKVVSLAKDYGLKVFCHSDGSIRELIPDLIEVGIDILNPIQTKCKGMVPGELKDEFGDRLSFHGGVDNQELMPFGTPAKVREEVLHLIDTLGRGGGYIVAPCHNLQPVTPLENILTMYETAYREGRYS